MNNRRKLAIALGVGMLTMLALMTYLIWSGYRDAIKDAETRTKDYAEILEARLEATLRRADAELQQLVRTTPLAALSKDAVSANAHLDASLKNSLINFPEVAGLSIFDVNGDTLYSSYDNPLRPINVHDRPHFRALRDNPRIDSVFTEVIVVRNTNRPSVLFARALRDGQGAFRSLVAFVIELEHFQKLFQALDVGAQGNVAIYRSDDFTQVLRWPAVEGKLNVPLPPNSPTRAALAGGLRQTTLSLTSATDGQVRIYSYHALTAYPFFISVGVAHNEVLAAWRTRSLVTGLSTLLLLGLLIGLLYRLLSSESDRIKLASIVENSNDAIYSRTFDGTILTWNAGAEKMLGYSAAEAIGKSSDFLIPGDRASNRAQNTEALLGGSMVTRETDRLSKDGRVIPVLSSQSPLRDSAGNVVGASIILQDITARKQAEDKLRNQAVLFDLANDAIIVRNLESEVVFWNRGAEQTYGWTNVEAFGNVTHDFLHTVFPVSLETVDQALFRENMWEGELTHTRRSGEQIIVTSRQVLQRDEHGQPIRILEINRDITARKQAEAAHASLEAQLRESQKMQAIGTLAGGIAHDFNNIIATILGNAELARQDATSDPRATQQSIEEIRKAGTRARDLVRQILSFSRRQATERKVIKLAPVIDESVRLLRAMIPPRIGFAVHCDADVPAVLADATQFEQIVMNLATNATHAMPGNGRIEIRLDTVLLDAALANTDVRLSALHERHPGRTVRLTVSDTGSGMDAATVAKIFEPFFTTKPVGEGTGLGLSVVYGIVQAHEGVITVDSTPGKGTTFTLYLPAAPADESATTTMASAAPATPTLTLDGGHHIFYLDDDEALVELVTRLLERSGYRVSSYINQREALAELRADPASFDLVVTDYNMPGMSGLDVAREVKAIRADLPVVVASGFIDEALQSQAAAAGVQEVIFKATAVEELSIVIARLAQTFGAKSGSA